MIISRIIVRALAHFLPREYSVSRHVADNAQCPEFPVCAGHRRLVDAQLRGYL